MPSVEGVIRSFYGTVQNWVNVKIAEEFENAHEAEVIKEKTEETVTTEDF